MRPSLLAFLATAALLALRLAVAAPSAAAAASRPEPIRGIVISCQTWGREWGTDEMVAALREVKALGANWVQIHPYLGIDREGNVGARQLTPGLAPEQAPVWLARPIREAHALGLKIAIVPHLAGWRAGWPWRGEIAFETEAEWARFFSSYQSWITTLARLCRDADAFSVGSELDRTVPGHEAEWRSIIAAVRAETPAALTYGANWGDYQNVPFWDALDAIGISAYFPLVDHERPPTETELDAAWLRLRRELDAYSKARDYKPVVFLELGYDESLAAARTPWADGRREPGALAVQTRCLDRALAALEGPAAPAYGAFLWKWFPGENRRENYALQSPALRAVLAARWPSAAAP